MKIFSAEECETKFGKLEWGNVNLRIKKNVYRKAGTQEKNLGTGAHGTRRHSGMHAHLC